MTKLGTIQADGSILLYDENIKFREQMTDHYRRIRQTTRQSVWLGEKGYTTIVSSFISAASVKDDDLYIRFHNGSLYVYYGFAKEFDNLMKANSKGQYFHRRIRPTMNYKKLGDMPFPTNIADKPMLEMSDEAMFKALDVDYIKKVAQRLTGAVVSTETYIDKGITMIRYEIKHNDKLLKILVPMITGRNIN